MRSHQHFGELYGTVLDGSPITGADAMLHLLKEAMVVFKIVRSALRGTWMLWLASGVLQAYVSKSTLSAPSGSIPVKDKRTPTRTASKCVVQWVCFDNASVSVVSYRRF